MSMGNRRQYWLSWAEGRGGDPYGGQCGGAMADGESICDVFIALIGMMPNAEFAISHLSATGRPYTATLKPGRMYPDCQSDFPWFRRSTLVAAIEEQAE